MFIKTAQNVKHLIGFFVPSTFLSMCLVYRINKVYDLIKQPNRFANKFHCLNGIDFVNKVTCVPSPVYRKYCGLSFPIRCKRNSSEYVVGMLRLENVFVVHFLEYGAKAFDNHKECADNDEIKNLLK